MAGHKAASAAPTWPDINGAFIPAYVLNRPEGLLSLIDNPIVIHFVHRMVAYLLVLLTIVWTFLSFKRKTSALFKTARMLPLVFIILQLALGIMSVLFSLQINPNQWGPFEWMAQLHQVVALFFLMSLALNLYILTCKEKSKYAAAIDPQVI